jgi:hypothetical protein
MPRINGEVNQPPGKPEPVPNTHPGASTPDTAEQGRRCRLGDLIAKYGSVSITAARLAVEVLTGRWP